MELTNKDLIMYGLVFVALLVAVLSISGIRNYPDDSIPGSALKDHDVDLEDIVADSITLTGDINMDGHLRTRTNRFVLDDVSVELLSVLQNDNTAASGVDTEINQVIFNNGLRLFSQNIGTQLLFYPQKTAAGFDISGDQADNDGLQYVVSPKEASTAAIPPGHRASDFTKHAQFTVGTSGAFFMRAVIEITDVSGTDDCLVGFRKVENFQANVDDYDEMAAFNIISGDINLETIKNGAATTTTDTTDNFADTNIFAFEVLVSATGVVTYKLAQIVTNAAISLAAPTAVAAYSFDSGEIVTPFLYVLQATDVTPVILHSLEYGLQ